ncbi:FGGY family carbohydrate kinase [Saccharopolyspora sp. WRP15-2]|uniref:FGGY family carbohydrate kinase n=1 Tax=Saccharopolyspora oryzae TaxID=2997343 RepID=A0ABT4V9D5_9PSEU|nr:FGGY family carbohydrate kinase [Saccharopolyspora oryzae]MDA3630548.1 FGGY family carbohydrate kinase [Saccharopolyspora oryzae]
MTGLMLGVDVGTTAVKVAVFELGGNLVATHTAAYPIHRPRPGWAEQDPMDWWRGCTEGIQAVLAGLDADAVRSVGVVSQVNTHVFVDDQLRPLAPAIIWQDQRCAEVARDLDARLTSADKTRIWGGPIVLDASFVGSRAEWFARTEPELWARTRWVLSPKDFVIAKLTGRLATDQLSAVRVAGPTGYLREAVELVDGLAGKLPEIAGPEVVLGSAPELGGAEVVVGTMDAYSAVFGTRTTESGRGMVSCGTSLVVAGASAESVPVPEVVTFPPKDGLFVHAGPTQAAGDALRWWCQASGLSIDEVLRSAGAGAPGVIFTPHLMGERAPLWDSEVRGSFFGLSSATSQADLCRAVLQGVAMSARHVLDPVERACGFALPSLAFSGGGARSDLWTQIHADVLQRPIERLRVHDSAVLGAALLGAVGTGSYPDIATAAAATVAVDRVFTPAADADRLNPLFEAYRESHDALRGIHARLADWRSTENC